MTDDPFTLADAYGARNAEALSTAYDAALFAISQGNLTHFPDRKVRLVLVEAMIEEGHRNGFVSERLREAALAAVGAATGSNRGMSPEAS